MTRPSDKIPKTARTKRLFAVECAIRDREHATRYRERAEQWHCDTETDIPKTATVTITPDGAWVEARLWIGKEEIDG